MKKQRIQELAGINEANDERFWDHLSESLGNLFDAEEAMQHAEPRLKNMKDRTKLIAEFKKYKKGLMKLVNDAGVFEHIAGGSF